MEKLFDKALTIATFLSTVMTCATWGLLIYLGGWDNLLHFFGG